MKSTGNTRYRRLTTSSAFGQIDTRASQNSRQYSRTKLGRCRTKRSQRMLYPAAGQGDSARRLILVL